MKALALGDIGHYFPPSDPQWKGADSQVLLSAVYKLVQERGWAVGNVDAVVIAERPKLKPHINTMRDRLAQTLGIDRDQISLKATTNEKQDAVGQEKAIAAYAVALLVQS